MSVIVVAPQTPIPVHAEKVITFTGAAGAGAVGTVTAFTITGKVIVRQIFGVTSTPRLAGNANAKLSLGVTGNTAAFIGLTNVTGFASGTVWTETTPSAYANGVVPACRDAVVTNNILITCATADTTSGVLKMYAIYEPLTDNGALT